MRQEIGEPKTLTPNVMPRFTSVFLGVICVALMTVIPANAQLTLRMQVPDSTPDGYTVYVAGNWNNWNPAHAAYALTETSPGMWEIVLPSFLAGELQFKFTLGDGDWYETNDRQESTPNRVVTIQANTPAEYNGTIDAWQYWSWPFANSTVTAGVGLLSSTFEMPQLGRIRRVMTYTPPNYETSGRRYPVIYALDSQFLFDGTIRSEWGEIRMDEQMDSLFAAGDPGAIVVAVEADFAFRNNEYLPFFVPNLGGGQAEQTLAFITDTLKPYVDANFRTLADREHTAFFGISNGGVFGTYAAMMRPDVFGRYLIFSASFCLNQPMYEVITETAPSESFLRMAFVSGPEEFIGPCLAGSFSDGQLEAVSHLQAAGYDMSNIRSEVVSPSEHALWFWEGQFADLYLWLMTGVSTGVESSKEVPPSDGRLSVYPNPVQSTLRVDYSGPENTDLLVFDSLGRVVTESRMSQGTSTLYVDHLQPGLYFIRVGTEIRKWIKQ